MNNARYAWSAPSTPPSIVEGLTRAHFKMMFLRALDTFNSEWPWDRIGRAFATSDRWAESAYDAATVQAARRAGILPMSTNDHAILCCGVWHDAMDRDARGWLRCITTSAERRQEASNLRSKNPLRTENAAAIWTNSKPLPQRIAIDARKHMANRSSHGAWFRVNPDEVVDRLIGAAREIEATWHLEEPFASRVAA